jgi:hypothetical protein
MSIRTIRLDDSTERLLSKIRETTGLSISAALKEGLKVFQGKLEETKNASPFEIYRSLNLGPGGYARTSSSETKKAVKEAIRRKLHR